jgi:hypothetical protein
MQADKHEEKNNENASGFCGMKNSLMFGAQHRCQVSNDIFINLPICRVVADISFGDMKNIL